ncbi:MAG: PBP1A family penicillin-binding protein [Alicyclobacillus sp.]|nr:PBP1A family penicillin-binding protein [Alicyclobacillus sp.]
MDRASRRHSRWLARWRSLPRWQRFLVLPWCCGFLGTTALLLALRAAPLPDPSLVYPTHLDAGDGTRLAEWTRKGTSAEHVPLAQIPPALQAATLAVEDARFYQHGAFHWTSLLRASWVDLVHGRIVQGGSTISQQLAKNLYLNQQRTLGRKLREALYALQLELHESKPEILEQYLNTVYYGHGAYGVGAAAQLYFGKPVTDLSLAECALLAGLPKGPSLYSPLLHPEAARARQRTVLQRMVQAGFLSQAEADAALRTPLQFAALTAPSLAAPYFTDMAVHEVKRRFHLTADDLDRGDLRIVTTLDPVLQAAAERAIASTLPTGSRLQAALVALDPQTGQVLAMVGGRDYAQSPYNRALAERQPGSTFKAVVYAAALSHGWTPDRQVLSEPTTFMYDRNQLYTVHDYGDFYAHRPITLREALARSDNVYAVTANLEVGPQQVVAMARRLGFQGTLQPYPALALGVFPTSPMQLATTYAALANGGKHVLPYAVQALDDPRGGHHWTTLPVSHQALDPAVAFQLTDLLRSVLEPGGTGYAARPYLHGPAAAKTGTTNTDAWMVGFTPRVVCAVWVGYDDNRPLTVSEAHLAAPIWGKFMGTAQQRRPSDWFTPPPNLVPVTLDPVTGQLATPACGSTETDYFVAGTAPVESCALHSSAAPPAPAPATRPWWRRWWP